jgi:phage terminase large subunit-like protein
MNYNPEKYGKDVLSGKIPACEYVRLSVAKHFEEKKKKWEYYFDKEAGLHPIKFFSIMRHYKGEFYGQKFTPLPWQAWCLYVFFGWKRKDGRRRFKYMYIEVPRKNGKSTYMAGIAHYHLLKDNENAPEIYFAATKEKQARICLDEARNIGKFTPELSERLTIRKFDIEYEERFGKMESLGGDSKKQDGLNVSLGVIDEFHEHKTLDMMNVLKTAGGMRASPMICIITTAGFHKEYPCYTYRKQCIDILTGVKKQDNLFSMIYGLDEEDDWKSEESWSKANPSWDIINQEEYRDEAEEAIQFPHAEVNFRTKRLNVWTNAESVWIKDDDWMKCAGEVRTDFGRIPCYGGLDLASTKDINALVLNFPIDGIRHFKCWFWIPEKKVQEKEDIVDYLVWKRQGYIRVIPGNAIDQDELAKDILSVLSQYNVVGLAYDRWGSDGVVQTMLKSGFSKMSPYKQTTLDMTVPVKELEASIMMEKINHEGNPVLRWMASNVVIHMDSAGGMKFDKSKSIDKIDGMVAMAMSVGEELSGPTVFDGKIRYV